MKNNKHTLQTVARQNAFFKGEPELVQFLNARHEHVRQIQAEGYQMLETAKRETGLTQARQDEVETMEKQEKNQKLDELFAPVSPMLAAQMEKEMETKQSKIRAVTE